MLVLRKLADEIFRIQGDLEKKGEIFSNSQIDGYCKVFRDRFGPETLSKLDGEILLETMQNSSNPDSLTYWLEYKNDEEFPSPMFGSIAGGSALKFGIYKRKETGAWTTGSPTKQIELDIEEAVSIAKKHREQLAKGVRILEQHPIEPHSDSNYIELQNKMDSEAPDVSNTAWGHKYFSLMFPEKLDFYHNPAYQRFYLIKLLQKPPLLSGRYACAGRYVSISKELNIHIRNLGRILDKMNERPHKYWRIGTTLGKKSIWELMKENSCAAVGWEKIGDLSDIEYNKEGKGKIKSEMQQKYPSTPSAVSNQTQQLFNFVAAMNDGDLIVSASGQTVRGIGRITGEYFYAGDSEAPHRRPVRWLSLAEWKIHEKEGLQTTVKELAKPVNLVKIEQELNESPVAKLPSVVKLAGIPGRIQSILERKGQVILYGPPGTGKTYWAEKAAKDLGSHSKFGRLYEELSEDEKVKIAGNFTGTQGLVRMCTFHPAYGYEDFIEGYRPETTDGRMAFRLRDGILKTLCEDAIRNGDNEYYLIIDEINRGDIPRIFGELLTIMEKDKRGRPLLLSGSGNAFYLPENVFFIGTMNTADRSIALLDTALRRRFGFIELMPDASVLGNAVVEGIPLGPFLESLNAKICEHIGRDSRNLQIGHSYLLNNGKPVNSYSKLVGVMRDDIFPLVEEYCYEDYHTILKILGQSFVDEKRQRIRGELFEADMKDDFIQALKSIDPTLDSSSMAVQSEAEKPDEEDEEEDADNEGTE